MKVLAGDIGGTKVRLALFDCEGDRLLPGASFEFESRRYETFDKLLSDFRSKCTDSFDALCIGVAGPVADGAVRATNLPWELSERGISKVLKIERVKLVNDLVATASAIPYLHEKDLKVLRAGAPKRDRSVAVVVAPGTGLGQASLWLGGPKPVVLPSEGGHVDLAPTDELEMELLSYLKQRLERVSVERLLSGPGILNIYQFLRDTHHARETGEIARRISEENPSAVISRAAMAKDDELCIETMRLFTRLLGAHCGNVVLTLMATCGLYLGGGIPPKIAPLLSTSDFLEPFCSKGRLSPLVEATPIYLVLDDHAALHGAAWTAIDLARG